ncbi:hypothetical protein D3C72_2258110 [compost metagenome]
MISLISSEDLLIKSMDSIDLAIAWLPISASFWVTFANSLARFVLSAMEEIDAVNSSMEAFISSTVTLKLCAPEATPLH